MGWAGSAYQYGILATHWYWIGAIPAMLFLGLVMMPFYYVSKTHSVPGYLNLRYGEGARALAAVSFAFMMILMSGVNMFAMAVVMKVVLGWNINFSIWSRRSPSRSTSCWAACARPSSTRCCSSCSSGAARCWCPILGLIEAGGWRPEGPDHRNMQHGLRQLLPPVARHRQLCRQSHGRALDRHRLRPGLRDQLRLLDHRLPGRPARAGGANLRAARMAPIIGSFFKMAVPFIVILPGLLGLVLLQNPDGSRRQWWAGHMVASAPALLRPMPAGSDMASTHGAQKVLSGRGQLAQLQRGLPLMMVRYLGPGLLGLGITALIAGFMSGMAGNVSAFSTVWTYDIYKPLINKKGQTATMCWWAAGRLSSAWLSPSAPLPGAARARHHGLRAGALQLLHRAAAGPPSARHVLEARHQGGRLLGPAARHRLFGRACSMWVKSLSCALATWRFRPTPSRWPRMSFARCGHSCSPPSWSLW
jgi:solute:Na+ symporter, SSS family